MVKDDFTPFLNFLVHLMHSRQFMVATKSPQTNIGKHPQTKSLKTVGSIYITTTVYYF